MLACDWTHPGADAYSGTPRASLVTATRLRSLLSYNPDTGRFGWLVDRNAKSKAGDPAGCEGSQGYIDLTVDGRKYKAHRLAWLHFYGQWPTKDIDHINGVRGDNRIKNLRLVSNEENSWNRNKANRNSRTGVIGVSVCKWNPELFVAALHKNGKQKFLGRFRSIAEAKAAYEGAKAEHLKGLQC